MTMQISIFGIAIAAVYAWIVVGLLVLLWYPLRHWRFTWVPFAVAGLMAIAAPWAEEYLIASRFEELCKDAGVHVYRKVEVEGYYDATGGGTAEPGPTYPPTGGRERFRFHERLVGYDPKSDPLRISHVENIGGVWTVTILDRPTARYHFKRAFQPTPFRHEEPVGWKIEKMELQVVDSQTGEVLGRDTKFKRRPSVIEGIWINLVGSGLEMCSGPLDDPEKQKRIGLVDKYVLHPKKAD